MMPLPRWAAALPGRRTRVTLFALDIAIVLVATVLGYYARFDGRVPDYFAPGMPWVFAAAAVVYVSLLAAFGLYRLVLRYVGIETGLRIGAAVTLGFALLLAVDAVAPRIELAMRPVPFGVLFDQAVVVFIGIAAVRLAVRVSAMLRVRHGVAGTRPVVIVGAGGAGSLLLREIKNRPELGLAVIGFLDDDPTIRGRIVGGVPVIGTTEEIARIAEERHVDEVLVALPTAPQSTLRRVLNAAADAGVKTRVMPPLVVAKGSVSITDLRKVEVEDLLGREQTPIDFEKVRETLSGKIVAVTGAAGSIGSELCRQIVKLGPARLVLVEIDETRLYELFLELEAMAPGVAVMQICDIRDEQRLDAVFAEERPEVVLHAAAYKHVPLMELAPEEAFKANVLGTRLVIQACEKCGAERFVLISTDKAVAPVNVMGMTKALAERVMLAEAKNGKVRCVAVRFGNVLASRGSVIPIFETQLRHGGPLTVTHPDVTRYFMTIPEAARLVLQAQAIGETGEIFVLEMGEPVRILDLARKMIALSGVPAEIEFIGLRPGEKLAEELTHDYETLQPTGAEKVLRVSTTAEESPLFEQRLTQLFAAAEAGDRDGVLAGLTALDPHFAARELAS